MLLRVFNIDGEILCYTNLTLSIDFDRFNVTITIEVAFYYIIQNLIQYCGWFSKLFIVFLSRKGKINKKNQF